MKNLTLFILKLSRPKFWLYLAGPFLLGYSFNFELYDLSTFFSNHLIFGFIYFLFFANLFLYGINDYSDTDTDEFNAKKGTKELKLKNKESVKKYLYISLIVSIIYFFSLPNVTSKLLLLLFIFLSFAYSAKPFRFKAKPIIDSASNFLYVIPALISYNIVTNNLVPLQLLFAFFCWTFAMHLFSAIPDIEADKKAGLKTTAILFGYKKSLILCSIMWLIFSLILIYNFGDIFLVTLIYSLLPLVLIINRIMDIEEIYWKFPLLNAIIGFIGFLLIVFRNNFF